MSYTKLVLTVLKGDDEKYEVYGGSEHSEAHRIIHYKLQQRKFENVDETNPTFEWVIIDPNVVVPKHKKSQPAVNWLWDLYDL